MTDAVGRPPEDSRWRTLTPFLELLCTSDDQARSLEDTFEEADRAAQAFKTHFQRVVALAAGAGFVALATPLLRLSLGASSGPLWLGVEGASAALALGLVFYGLLSRLQRRWLLARHKAERLRMLKFGLLADARFWSVDEDARASLHTEVCRQAEEIGTMDHARLRAWAAVPFAARNRVHPPPGSAAPLEVADYYRSARLDDQVTYFHRMAHSHERNDRRTRALPELAFFGGVLLALVVVFADVAGLESSIGLRLGLFLALALPAAAGGVKAVRTAFEFARNRERFRATWAELHRAAGKLDAAGEDTTAVAAAIAEAEDALEREHREWLRLMLEAEWY